MGISKRLALIEAGSPSLNIYSHVAMGRGVSLLATVMRDAGWEARAFIEDISGKDSIDWEFIGTASVVGFSAITCTMPRTAELVARTRELNPSATILFGGPEPTCNPGRSFDIGADMVLRAEAELTLPRLLAILNGESHESFRDIEGLMWLEEGRVRESLPTKQLTRNELDALPNADHTLVHESGAMSVAPVWRTRGCPSRCDFCEVGEMYPRCVRRSDDRAIDELMQAQSRGYSTSFLIDDNAAANKPAFMDFLRKAASSGYASGLVTQLRADSVFRKDGRIDREFIKLLKRAATITIVCVGVESATDENLEALHKDVDAKRMARALRAMKRAGLLVHGMFIALTDDTREAIKRNGDYARKYVTSLQYLFETPLPGTRRTEEHEAAGNLLFERLEDLSFYDGMHCVLRPLKMRADEMQKLVEREYRRFYSVRRIVGAALEGTFVRFRTLTEAQHAILKALPIRRRITRWLRFHIEYKYGPVAFLAIGRRRVRDILGGQPHADFLAKLSAVSAVVDESTRC